MFMPTPHLGGRQRRGQKNSIHGTAGVFVTLLMSILGAGVYSIPHALKEAGIVCGSLLVLLTAIGNVYTGELLLRTRVTMDECNSIEQCFLIALGRKASLLFDVLTLMAIFGAAVSYVALAKELIPDILKISFLKEHLHVFSPSLWTILLFSCVVMPICLLRHIGSLRYSSYVGFCLCIYIVALNCTEAELADGNDFPGDMWWPKSLAGIAKASGVCNFSFVLHLNIIPLYNELLVMHEHAPVPREAALKTMNRVMRYVCATISGIYLLFGITGLQHYKSAVNGNLLQNFGTSPMYQIARGATIVVAITSCPLIFHPLRSIAHQLMRRVLSKSLPRFPRKPGLGLHVVETFSIWALAIVAALQVPGLDFVFSLTGGTCIVGICYIFPAVAFCTRASRESFKRAFWSRFLSGQDDGGADTAYAHSALSDGEQASKPEGEKADEGSSTQIGLVDSVAIPVCIVMASIFGMLATVFTVKGLF